ncbi:MAG TPA: serine/threonine-protein kinase [Nocardioides sp.]
MTGPALPGFTYLDRLGTGGFAEVFLYEQEWPRRKVAVKVVRPDVPLTEREKALFTSEANSMAQLADHPYIVTVISAGILGPADGSRPYLVLRYCPPPDLGVRVRSTPLTVPDALATGIKLASAIETAHRAGILHRDIKPSNVLVTTYGEPALTDFGIAGRIHEVDADREVRISFPWSSPELLDGRSNGSVSSDVYSLGATIWNLLVGRSPFAQPQGDNSARALSVRILHQAPPLTQRRDVPPAFDRLLQQCLAKDPAHRPSTALELARGMQQIEAQLGFARTPIAVEGGVGVMGGSSAPVFASPQGGDDATVVKPVSIVPAGERRRPDAAPAGSSGPAADAEPPRRGVLGWSVAGGALLLVAALAIFFRPGGGDNPETDPTTGPTTHTPLPVEPGVPMRPPELSATRKGSKVLFTWTPSGTLRDGDTFEWKRDDTGASGRTASTRLGFKSTDRVCLQVRQIHNSFTSGWEQGCA